MTEPNAPAPPTSSPDGRITTRRQGHVLHITIDRPAKLNGFTPTMVEQLARAYTDYEADAELWCAVLGAEGKHFTAGLQLDRFDITERFVPEGLVDPLGLLPPHRTKPVVAAVKGICFTIGIELMLACDIVVAATDTRFAQLEVRRGLMPFGGATMRMVQRSGWGNAMRWLLTGGEFDGPEAHRIGLVQQLCPADEVDATATRLAEEIAAQAPLAVQASRANAMHFLHEGEASAVAAFAPQLAALAASEDFAEGVQSFLERRAGNYRGR